MPPAPRVRGPKVVRLGDKRVATQAEWDKIVDKVVADGRRKLDDTSIEHAASRVRFKLFPPETPRRKSGSGLPLDVNLSKATEALYRSEPIFQRYKTTCKRCNTLGNVHCFFLPKSEYTECVLCWASGKPLRSPRRARRDAVDKLVRLARDPAKAGKILKEYEDAEEEGPPKDRDLWFRRKKPQ
ncbi:uncharacterized protein LOC62_06G007873 [Vanrija pseudolonga]|uniref:Uncharacterized protein n=1 Tax=Vanrija pseudolonga TaxID=143232 RepID=A0AAF0YIT6_9TREE|nr:hypothetical protein LOC62_06G007873 [Vanrija pseudolonga]